MSKTLANKDYLPRWFITDTSSKQCSSYIIIAPDFSSLYPPPVHSNLISTRFYRVGNLTWQIRFKARPSKCLPEEWNQQGCVNWHFHTHSFHLYDDWLLDFWQCAYLLCTIDNWVDVSWSCVHMLCSLLVLENKCQKQYSCPNILSVEKIPSGASTISQFGGITKMW